MTSLLDKERELVRGVQLRTAYRVYLCLLKSRTASAKDIQKAMEFPTVAQAKYHLKKLMDLGLAKKNENEMFTGTDRRFGILRFFFRIKNSIFPLSVFYSIFFGLVTAVLFFRSASLEVLLLGGLITTKEIADTYMFYVML